MQLADFLLQNLSHVEKQAGARFSYSTYATTDSIDSQVLSEAVWPIGVCLTPSASRHPVGLMQCPGIERSQQVKTSAWQDPPNMYHRTDSGLVLCPLTSRSTYQDIMTCLFS